MYEIGRFWQNERTITLHRAFQALEVLRGLFDEVVLTGGEPILLPIFWDLVQAAKTNGFSVGVLTNGIGVSDDFIGKMLQSKLNRISVSIDSIDSQTNEEVRQPRCVRQSGYTEGVVGRIRTLARLRPPGLTLQVLQTVTHRNLHSIDEMIAFCEEEGILLAIWRTL